MIINDKDQYLLIAQQIEKHLGLQGVTINYRFRFQEHAMVRTVHGNLLCAGYMNGSVVDHHYNVVVYYKRDFVDTVRTIAHELRHVWQDENNGIRLAQTTQLTGNKRQDARDKAKQDPAEIDARWFSDQYAPVIETINRAGRTMTRISLGFNGKINP